MQTHFARAIKLKVLYKSDQIAKRSYVHFQTNDLVVNEIEIDVFVVKGCRVVYLLLSHALS